MVAKAWHYFRGFLSAFYRKKISENRNSLKKCLVLRNPEDMPSAAEISGNRRAVNLSLLIFSIYGGQKAVHC